MQPSRLPLTLALIAFALAFIAGTFAYNRTFRTVPVLVAARDIAAGTALNESLVRVIQVPAGATEPRALYGPGQVAGMYAAVPLFQDEMLTARQVTDVQPAAAAPALGPDERAIAVPVRAEAALRPGDLVDVAAAWPGEGKAGEVTVLVSGARIVDLRNGPDQPSALVAVKSAQAGKVVGALESKASLYLMLVGRDHK